MDEAMCAVFGTEIKTAIVEAINKMDWPDEGLARAERAVKVAQLRTREARFALNWRYSKKMQTRPGLKFKDETRHNPD